MKTKIIIITTYFGEWPVWLPAFLLSCAKNEDIEWLIVTDCSIPSVNYHNVNFERMDLAQFNELASKKLGFCVEKTAYSQVDLQPAYGVIFEEYINGYDFWGHCDLDVVWGDIRCFITEEILQNYDIVSPRKDFLAGHLTLWRNQLEISRLFKAVPAYRKIFSSSEHFNFDESVISTFLKNLAATNKGEIRIFWPQQMIVWFRGSRNGPSGWYWREGKLFDDQHREHIYLHYQEWKKRVTYIDFQFEARPKQFRFTRNGIRSRHPTILEIFSERFTWRHRKEIIDGSLDIAKKSITFLKKALLLRNFYWAKRLSDYSVSAKDAQYEPKTTNLFLQKLGLSIDKQQHTLLSSYNYALQLVEQRKAEFYNENGELVIRLAGLNFSIQCAEEIVLLKELFIDGAYNLRFGRPAIVLDIGTKTGFTSLFFARHSDVSVIGYEPDQRQYNQALHNTALNPSLSSKIQTSQIHIGSARFKTIAGFPPKIENAQNPNMDSEMGPRFDYKEIEIEDVIKILDTVTQSYPEREIVVKIDYGNPEYYVDGVSEYPLIKSLYTTGKLDLVDVIMMSCYKKKVNHDPQVIAYQLSMYGFQVFLLTPSDPHKSMIYAVKKKSSGR